MQVDTAFGRILELVRRLRKRSRWPAAQTRDTLRPYLVEEVLELEQALGRDDPDEIQSELGDLLLHAAFQIVIAEERNEFDADDVADGLERKMRRRHPNAWEDVAEPESWERAKAQEPRSSVLDGLPPTLAPLLMAFRLQERAAGAGFDWPDADGPRAKVHEELAEIDGAGDDPARLAEEVGDLFFAVVNLSRKLDVIPTNALAAANGKFRSRFIALEDLAKQRGLDIWVMDLKALDELWNEVKATA